MRKKGDQQNLSYDIKEFLKKFFSSRLFVLAAVFIILFATIIIRVFTLQIVNGKSYQENFSLLIQQTRPVEAARGNIYDKNGNMSIPFMDKNLAQRIELLDPETIRFALKDLLTDDEINATIRRLDKTRNAIERQRMEDPSRLLEDDEWNDDTAQRLIDDSWEKIGRFNSIDNGKEAAKVIDDTKLQQNYFGKYMISSVGNKIYAWNYGKTKSPQIRRKQQ